MLEIRNGKTTLRLIKNMGNTATTNTHRLTYLCGPEQNIHIAPDSIMWKWGLWRLNGVLNNNKEDVDKGSLLVSFILSDMIWASYWTHNCVWEIV